MPDGGTGETNPVTEPDPVTAAERAVRAAMRISARHGCALTRQAAEQITDAILALAAEAWDIPAREEARDLIRQANQGLLAAAAEYYRLAYPGPPLAAGEAETP